MRAHRIVRVRKREDHNRSRTLCESNYVLYYTNRTQKRDPARQKLESEASSERALRKLRRSMKAQVR